MNRLGLVLSFGGVNRRLVLWVDFGFSVVAKFQFRDGCWNAGFVVVVLRLVWWFWVIWVCCNFFWGDFGMGLLGFCCVYFGSSFLLILV